jgi:pSer/pThr/pTyr-binding forkhead associated (FHA) protein
MRITLKAPRPWDGVEDVQIESFPFTLGRRGDSDGSLRFAFVSRQHCQLSVVNDRLIVQDLESFNGTFINGRRVDRPAALEHGDELSLGPLSFRVFLHSAAGETTVEGFKIPTHEMPQVNDSCACFQRNLRKHAGAQDHIRL